MRRSPAAPAEAAAGRTAGTGATTAPEPPVAPAAQRDGVGPAGEGRPLAGYFPEPQFLTLDGGPIWPLLAAGMAGAAIVALLRAPRAIARGLGAVLVFALLAAVVFPLRAYGYYFHFKVLAFCAPLLLCCAAAGLARLRRGPSCSDSGCSWLRGWRSGRSARPSISSRSTCWPCATSPVPSPPGASIRLDVEPGGVQLWAAYMLAPHPLCSQEPLANTSYPHVPVSRKANYLLVWARPHFARVPLPQAPFDAVGPPVQTNGEWALYRMNPAVPGPDTCSKLRVQTVISINPSS